MICSSPEDDYWGTAVKILNHAPYENMQRRFIRERLGRSSPDDKKKYEMFFCMLGVIAFLLILLCLYNWQKIK